jgi:hypothetical protein
LRKNFLEINLVKVEEMNFMSEYDLRERMKREDKKIIFSESEGILKRWEWRKNMGSKANLQE